LRKTAVPYCLLGLIFLVLCSSCEDEILLDLTPHSPKKLVINGSISDRDSAHLVTVEYTRDLNSSSKEMIDDAIVTVDDGSVITSLTNLGDGTYSTPSNFSANYGSTYNFQIIHGLSVHEYDARMPFPVSISNLEVILVDDLNDASFGTDNGYKILAEVTSSDRSYLRGKVFYADTTFLPNDTIWIEIPSAAHDLAYAPSGINQPVELDRSISLAPRSLLKIDFEILESEVGSYLGDLRSFSVLQSTAFDFGMSPPFLFSNEAYGICYCTIRSTQIYQMID
jgi:hypothetical protein